MKYPAVLFAGIAFTGAAFGQQQYEIGANTGYGWYHDGTISSPYGTAQAGIKNRFVAGITLGDDFSNYVSAEFRYLYHDGHPFFRRIFSRFETLDVLFLARASIGTSWSPQASLGAVLR
jgi:hypothetical protein